MSPSSFSRRTFLKVGCLTGAAVGLTACGGIALVAALAPADPSPADLPTLTLGEKKMNKRALIAYASYAGSTAEVSAEIGKTLELRGYAVDVKPIKEKPSLDGYDAVLVGSAVQYGKWLAEGVDFVKTNQSTLNRLPTALFCVHITNMGDDETSRKNRLTFLDQVRPLVPGAPEAFFAGRFDRRGAALLLPGLVARFMPTFDKRDWNKIRSWGKAVFA